LSLQLAEDKFGMLHAWIEAHLAEDLLLAALARQAGMSEQSFSRHYVEATGLTPARSVERLRVEAARRLLSDSRLPVKRISQRCGCGSEKTAQLPACSVSHAAGLSRALQFLRRGDGLGSVELPRRSCNARFGATSPPARMAANDRSPHAKQTFVVAAAVFRLCPITVI
jgi:AraC-like DNA-binding protein